MSQKFVQIRFGSPEALRHEFEKNISNRGIFVATERTFEVRETVDVQIVLEYVSSAATGEASTDGASKASNVAMTLHGEVVHCIPVSMETTGATPGVAIQFDDSARKLCESFEPLLAAAATENSKTPSADDGVATSPESRREKIHAPPLTNRERRGARREAVRVPVRIMPTMSPPFEATSRDLSASGILLTVRTVALPIGEVVRTCLWHPSGDPSIEIDGLVVREIKNKNGRIAAVAIAFDRHQAADSQTRDLIDGIRQMGHRSRLGGISGSIVDLGLANMLQMFGSSAPQGTLVVDRDGEQGWIAFAKGQFLNAELGALVGAEALIAMLDWGEGRFHFEATVDKKIIANGTPQSLEDVVFDAVCALDERSRCGSEDEQVDGQVDVREEVCIVGESTKFMVDREQEESLRASLGKTEDAVLELARSGMETGKLKEIIPESPEVIQEALESLVERGVLIPR